MPTNNPMPNLGKAIQPPPGLARVINGKTPMSTANGPQPTTQPPPASAPLAAPLPRIAAQANDPAVGGLGNPNVQSRDLFQQRLMPKQAASKEMHQMIQILRKISLKPHHHAR